MTTLAIEDNLREELADAGKKVDRAYRASHAAYLVVKSQLGPNSHASPESRDFKSGESRQAPPGGSTPICLGSVPRDQNDSDAAPALSRSCMALAPWIATPSIRLSSV